MMQKLKRAIRNQHANHCHGASHDFVGSLRGLIFMPGDQIAVPLVNNAAAAILKFTTSSATLLCHYFALKLKIRCR